MVRSLAERMRAHEQQKPASPNRKQNSRTPNAARARTRRLIEAGGLIDKADLLDLDANALMARCSHCAMAPTTRIRSTNGPRWAGVPSPMRRACATKARSRSSSPFPRRSVRTRPTRCGRRASASARCSSTGRGSPASRRLVRSSRNMAAPRAGSARWVRATPQWTRRPRSPRVRRSRPAYADLDAHRHQMTRRQSMAGKYSHPCRPPWLAAPWCYVSTTPSLGLDSVRPVCFGSESRRVVEPGASKVPRCGTTTHILP
jgi:hypothetical protein